MTIEWDYASYRRKYVSTWAYCQGPKLEPAWRYITDILDSGAVYDTEGCCIGYVCSEENRIIGENCRSPEMHFIYKSVPPGLYWDIAGKKVFLLTKTHHRQFEVGIGLGGFSAYYLDAASGALKQILRWTTAVRPDFDSPAPPMATEEVEIYNSQLYRIKKNLFCFKEIVGFMEDGLCFLRNQKFTPLVKPYLGEKWQIVNL